MSSDKQIGETGSETLFSILQVKVYQLFLQVYRLTENSCQLYK